MSIDRLYVQDLFAAFLFSNDITKVPIFCSFAVFLLGDIGVVQKAITSNIIR